MAMTKCKECGKDISTKAEQCPSCGAKVQKKLGVVSSIIVVVVIFFAGKVFIDFIFSAGKEVHAAVKEVRESVQAEKKDPAALIKELESKCAATAREAPESFDKNEFYKSCVAGGRAQFRAQGIIK